MKKEKQVKSYQRRTKSGKVVTVKAHTAKYDAAEKAKEAAKKKGAGKELEDKFGKKKMPDPNLSMNEYLDELKKGNAEKKIAEEVKAGSKKSSKDKVRPVGSGTNGPEPKKKSETKGSDFTTKEINAAAKSMFERGKVGIGMKSWRDVARALKHDLGLKGGNDAAKTAKSIQKELSKTTTSAPKPKSTKATTKQTSESAFTASEFKEWYHGTGSAADKKVAKALRAQLGRSGYRKFEDEAINNYSSRGHLSMFKKVGSMGGETVPKKS